MKSEYKIKRERLARTMKISPFKKLEWINEMREFTLKFYSKRDKKIWLKLRASHQ